MQIRFTWLRSFHHPVVVRVEGIGTASVHLTVKQLSGAGGYAPGAIDKQVARDLSPDEVEALKTVLTRTDVFNRPHDCNFGVDGAQWLVEAVDGTGYHFVNEWSPERGGVRELGLAMLKLTGWTFPDLY